MRAPPHQEHTFTPGRARPRRITNAQIETSKRGRPPRGRGPSWPAQARGPRVPSSLLPAVPLLTIRDAPGDGDSGGRGCVARTPVDRYHCVEAAGFAHYDLLVYGHAQRAPSSVFRQARSITQVRVIIVVELPCAPALLRTSRHARRNVVSKDQLRTPVRRLHPEHDLVPAWIEACSKELRVGRIRFPVWELARTTSVVRSSACVSSPCGSSARRRG